MDKVGERKEMVRNSERPRIRKRGTLLYVPTKKHINRVLYFMLAHCKLEKTLLTCKCKQVTFFPVTHPLQM